MKIKKVLQFSIALMVLADAYVLSIWPTSRLLGMSLVGHSYCSLGDTLSSAENVRWILASRDRMARESRLAERDGALERWQTPRGSFWIPETSAKMFPLVLAEQENQIYGTGDKAVRPGSVVLDCGADVGTFTRTALTQGASLVVAVEPMPQKEPCLRRTFAPEIAAGRVIVYPKGVWDKDDVLILYGDSVVEQRTETGVRVPLTTIDEMVKELKLARVDFIKMDIEGAEKKALAGASGTLRRFKPRLAIAAEHLPDDSWKIPEVVHGIRPDYRSEYGHCEYDRGRVRPQVLYFY